MFHSSCWVLLKCWVQLLGAVSYCAQSFKEALYVAVAVLSDSSGKMHSAAQPLDCVHKDMIPMVEILEITAAFSTVIQVPLEEFPYVRCPSLHGFPASKEIVSERGVN